jgi:DNA polymerase III epsilon subunit-like protein
MTRLLNPGQLGIIIDTETGGFSRQDNAFLEVGCLVVDHSYNIVDSFQAYAIPEPGKTVEPGAAEINGYTPQKWGDFGDGDPSDEELAEVVHPLYSLSDLNDAITEWLGGRRDLIAIAHNKGFDKAWVREKLPALFAGLQEDWRDTQVAYKRWKKDISGVKVAAGGSKLGSICEELRYEQTTGERWVRHTALDDCYATRFLAQLMDDAGWLHNA